MVSIRSHIPRYGIRTGDHTGRTRTVVLRPENKRGRRSDRHHTRRVHIGIQPFGETRPLEVRIVRDFYDTGICQVGENL